MATIKENFENFSKKFQFHSTLTPRGYNYLDSNILSSTQQLDLNELKMNAIKENEKYLARHPEVLRALVNLLLIEFLQNPIHKQNPVNVAVRVFNRSRLDLENAIQKYIKKKDRTSKIEEKDKPEKIIPVPTKPYSYTTYSSNTESKTLSKTVSKTLSKTLSKTETSISSNGKKLDLVEKCVEQTVDRTNIFDYLSTINEASTEYEEKLIKTKPDSDNKLQLASKDDFYYSLLDDATKRRESDISQEKPSGLISMFLSTFEPSYVSSSNTLMDEKLLENLMKSDDDNLDYTFNYVKPNQTEEKVTDLQFIDSDSIEIGVHDLTSAVHIDEEVVEVDSTDNRIEENSSDSHHEQKLKKNVKIKNSVQVII